MKYAGKLKTELLHWELDHVLQTRQQLDLPRYKCERIIISVTFTLRNVSNKIIAMMTSRATIFIQVDSLSLLVSVLKIHRNNKINSSTTNIPISTQQFNYNKKLTNEGYARHIC